MMKIKRPENKPVIAWNDTPRYILADFSADDVVEVDSDKGEILIAYGYEEIKPRGRKPKVESED